MEGHRAITSRGSSDGDLDSESFFNTVSDLVQRESLEIAPFVSSWHPALSQLREGAEQRRRKAENAIRDLSRGGRERSAARDLAKLIADPEIEFKIPEAILYNMKMAVVEHVENINSVEYLAPLCNYEKRQGQLIIATLNYDVCIEKCCLDEEISCSDGIGPEWTNELKFNSSHVQLLKLHGSASWDGQAGQSLRTAGDATGQLPAVLFGGRNKLTAEWPFFDLFIHWRETLIESTHLLVIGYSFRDDHVNAVLTRWMNVNSSRRILIVDPGRIDRDEGHPFRSLIDGESNISRSHWVYTDERSRRVLRDGPSPNPRIVHLKQAASEALERLGSILETWAPPGEPAVTDS